MEKVLSAVSQQGNAARNLSECHLTAVRMGVAKESIRTTRAGEDVEKGEPSYTGGEDVNWCSHIRRTTWRALKKLKVGLPCHPAIPLLGS